MICHITGTLRDLSGAALPSTSVSIERASIAGQYGDVVVGQPLKATSDGAGALVLDLYPGTYTMTVYRTGRVPALRTTLTVPQTTTAILAELIDGPDIAITPQAILDAQAARDAAQAYLTAMQALVPPVVVLDSIAQLPGTPNPLTFYVIRS